MVNKKILSLLLVLSMLFALLCGCGTPAEDGTDTTTTTTAADTTTTVADTTTTAPVEATPSELKIVVDGVPQYTIIRDEDATNSSTEVSLARSVMEQIKTLTGKAPSLGTDWVKKGQELNTDKLEILVGLTDYPATQEVIASLGYGDWAVRAIGNKIVIFGFDASSLSQAATQFNNLLKKAATDGKNITLTAEEINLTGTKSDQLNALPGYEGGSFGAYYAAGGGCDEIIIRDTNPEQYNAYLKKLEAAGYKQYTTHQITDNLFATYTNDKYTVTAGYYDYETSARLLIEPLAPAVGLKEDNVYTPVTTSQINMLGMELTKSDGSYTSNGLAVVIRLTDGRFVVVDGGHNNANVARKLYDTMMEMSADYRKADEKPTVAAWIVTHAHGDHYGALLKQTSHLTNLKIERFLVNYLSEEERQKAMNSAEYGDNWSGDGGDYTKMPGIVKTFGAELHQVHVGQVYYFADLKMEILYTIESYAPKICNAMNTSSTVMRMEFGGEGGTDYISTGDATGHGMEICTKMYGDYLQSDLVQVCHHGYSTWGNDNGVKMAYQAINAPTVLWPQGLHAYPNYTGKGYNAVLFTVPNYKEVYVSGALGDEIIIPIPYTVGSAIVKRVAE